MSTRERGKPARSSDGRQQESGPPITDNSVHSIARAFRVLEYLVHAEGGLPCSVKELSSALELAPSTIHRLLKTLCELGYVRQDAVTGRYEASMRTALLGRIILQRFRLADKLLPLMREIGAGTGESVSLIVAEDDVGILLERVEGSNPVQLSQSFRTAQLYCTAAGKAILACRSEAELATYLRGAPFAAVTPNTLCSAAKLETEISAVRRRGYAVDLEEHSVGAGCVAVAFQAENGTPAVLSVSSLAKRLTDQRIREVASLLETMTRKYRLRNLLPRSE